VCRGDIIYRCAPGGSGSILLLEQRRRQFRRKSAESKEVVLESVSLPIEAVDVVGAPPTAVVMVMTTVL
jgi:hypothetical protein